jgi:hypothetical protein
MTMMIMTVKVALSPVAMLTIARPMRIKLNGLVNAVRRIDMGPRRRSLECMFGPYSSRATRTVSLDNPEGLELGARL